MSGTTTDLGTRTITVDNAHASKPFGTIDTPGQGGTASGNPYQNVVLVAHEPCWFVRKKNAPWYGKAGQNSTIWDSPSPKFIMGGSDEDKWDHPTQKPVELMDTRFGIISGAANWCMTRSWAPALPSRREDF